VAEARQTFRPVVEAAGPLGPGGRTRLDL